MNMMIIQKTCRSVQKLRAYRVTIVPAARAVLLRRAVSGEAGSRTSVVRRIKVNSTLTCPAGWIKSDLEMFNPSLNIANTCWFVLIKWLSSSTNTSALISARPK